MMSFGRWYPLSKKSKNPFKLDLFERIFCFTFEQKTAIHIFKFIKNEKNYNIGEPEQLQRELNKITLALIDTVEQIAP